MSRIESIKFEVNIPAQHSIICDATLKLEVKATIGVIRSLEIAISKVINKEAED